MRHKNKIQQLNFIFVLFLPIISILSFVLYLLKFQRKTLDTFFTEINLKPRLDYWRTGLEIFKDNPWFGVGPDQFSAYSLQYREVNQVIRDGTYLIPDRAHNVLIDHLANGGIIAGALWLTFICLISWKLYKLFKSASQVSNASNIALIGGIWSIYLIQSFVSPDQIQLSCLGIMSAGLIYHLYQNQSPSSDSKLQLVFSTSSNWRFAKALLLLTPLILLWTSNFSQDVKAKALIYSNQQFTNSEIEVLKSWHNQMKLTQSLPNLLKNQQCQTIYDIAQTILKFNPRNSPALYATALCDYKENEILQAYFHVKMALEYDPINPDYLVAKRNLESVLGYKKEVEQTQAIIKRLFPDRV
jgi:hypothetical protein